MTVSIATMGMFNPYRINKIQITGGGGRIRVVDRKVARPVVEVSHVRYEEDEDKRITVTAVEVV